MTNTKHWVYILLCENNTYYTGYTVDLKKRYQLHISGKASKYTRSFKPIKIAQSWEIISGKKTAMQIERYIKKLSRKQKEFFINQPENLLTLILSSSDQDTSSLTIQPS